MHGRTGRHGADREHAVERSGQSESSARIGVPVSSGVRDVRPIGLAERIAVADSQCQRECVAQPEPECDQEDVDGHPGAPSG